MREPEVIVDFEKRRKLESILGAEQLSYCYQCGACVGDCPSARFYEQFNPREIMLRALIGDIDQLIKPDSIIWNCSNCYNCYERCPQDVRPVEVIIALKNLAVNDGSSSSSDEIMSIVNRINETGFSVPIVSSTNKLREELGLKPLKKINSEELKIIVQSNNDGREK
jgi:heterodisulfide reductase subunit C